MDYLYLVLLVIAIIFFAEKTGYRIINFGAFGILLYMGLNIDNVMLMLIFFFIGLALMGYSLFGDK